MANAQIIAIGASNRKSKSPPPSGSRAKLYAIPGIEGVKLPPQPPTLVTYEDDSAWQQINIKIFRIEDNLPRLKALGFSVREFEDRFITLQRSRDDFERICPRRPTSLMRTGTRRSYVEVSEEEAAFGDQLQRDLFDLDFEVSSSADLAERLESVFQAIDYLAEQITEPRYLVARKLDKTRASSASSVNAMVRFMANPTRELNTFRVLAKNAAKAICEKRFADAGTNIVSCDELMQIATDVRNKLDPRMFVEVISGGKK